MPTASEIGSMVCGSGTVLQVAQFFGSRPDDYLGLGNYPNEGHMPICLEFDLNFCLDRVVLSHWGLYEGPESAETLIQNGSKVSIEYFYGEHTKLPRHEDYMDPRPDNCNLSWSATFRDGLLLCLLSMQDASSQRLAEWVRQDLPFDGSLYGFSPVDEAFYKIVALSMQGAIPDDVRRQSLASEINSARTKRNKLLLRMLNAVEQGDAEIYLKATTEWARHYYKREFNSRMIAELISVEGSILAALGKRQGLTLDGLDEELKSAFVTRESLGLEG